jgi:hypothetical protein
MRIIDDTITALFEDTPKNTKKHRDKTRARAEVVEPPPRRSEDAISSSDVRG